MTIALIILYIYTFLVNGQAGVEKDSLHAQFTDNSLGGLSPLLPTLGGLKTPLLPMVPTAMLSIIP